MWLTWKYTLPAFLVPFVVVLSPQGVGLLFQGGAGTVLVAALAAAAAVAALAVVTGAWLAGPAGWPERVLFAVAALALLVMAPLSLGIGALAALAGIGVHLVRRRTKATGNQSEVNR
jgi:TRAP-type uncharacterized transport system fused permease subunit